MLVEEVRFETATEPTTVYNFQVEDFHTYYVGKSGILVHNAERYGNQHSLQQQELIKKGEVLRKEETLAEQKQRGMLSDVEVQALMKTK